jgi:hypothetical protein
VLIQRTPLISLARHAEIQEAVWLVSVHAPNSSKPDPGLSTAGLSTLERSLERQMSSAAQLTTSCRRDEA